MRRIVRTVRVIASVGFYAVLASSCSKSTTEPSSSSDSTIAASVSSIVATTDTTQVTAVSHTGTPPAPNGGPTLTVTSRAAASSGSANLVVIQSSAPFQTVFVNARGAASSMSVAVRTLDDTKLSRLLLPEVRLFAATSDYLEIDLPAPVTVLPIAINYSSSLSGSTLEFEVRVVGTTGAVGPIASFNESVTPPSVELVGLVLATWIGTPAHPGDKPDPVPGATASTSLSSRTATTDANGLFDLQTGSNSTSCYTLTISAPGLPAYVADRKQGNTSVVAYTLGSTPQYPTHGPCS